MKTLKFMLAVCVILSFNVITAQYQAYVVADNGLSIREKPNLAAKKIGKLDYGEAISITERTNSNLVIVDHNKTISGEWVKINTDNTSGYVFDGYLTTEKVFRNIEFNLQGIRLILKNLNTIDEFKIHTLYDKDSVNINVAKHHSPEGKTIVIKNKAYKHVSLFQRFENSIVIYNEDPKCHLTEWEHYNSDWVPLEALPNNQFKILSYPEHLWKRFKDIDIEALKAEVKRTCGQEWVNYVKDIKTVTDHPADIAMSKVFIKLILTDKNDNITEKVIDFKLFIGC